MVQQNCQEETTNSKAGTNRKEWRSQWRNSRRIGRVSTDRTNRWRWGPQWHLVNGRRLHLPSSRRTSSSILRAERRTSPYSNEIHLCDQGYLHKSGCVASKTQRWLLACGRESKFIRFVERIHKVHFFERETFKGIYVVRRETDKNSSNQEQRAAEIYDEVGQRSLERLFPGITEDIMTRATLSAGQSGIGFKRARDIAAPAHLGALTAAKTRILGMIRDGVRAGLLPQQILETRLSLRSSRPPPPPISALLLAKISRSKVTSSGSTLRAEERNIPYSFEIHWWYKVHWYYWKNLRKGYMWSGGKFDKDSNDYQTRLSMARSMDENWWSRSESKNRNGQKRNQNLTMLENWEEFILSIQMQEENWKDLWLQPCPASETNRLLVSGKLV